MASFNKFQDFVEQLAIGTHDFDTHSFKLALTNTLPTATQTALGQITQISGTNGYTTGGTTTTLSVSESNGTVTVNGTQVTFTASGGTMDTFQYYVLYNDTASSPTDALVAWWDHGSTVSLANGESFTVKFNNASPGAILTIN